MTTPDTELFGIRLGNTKITSIDIEHIILITGYHKTQVLFEVTSRI